MKKTNVYILRNQRDVSNLKQRRDIISYHKSSKSYTAVRRSLGSGSQRCVQLWRKIATLKTTLIHHNKRLLPHVTLLTALWRSLLCWLLLRLPDPLIPTAPRPGPWNSSLHYFYPLPWGVDQFLASNTNYTLMVLKYTYLGWIPPPNCRHIFSTVNSTSLLVCLPNISCHVKTNSSPFPPNLLFPQTFLS